LGETNDGEADHSQSKDHSHKITSG